MDIVNKLHETAKSLWRGDTINLGPIVQDLNEEISLAIKKILKLKKAGYEFPIEYFDRAISNLNIAMERNDVYLLSDNFYYEWAEIFSVYYEWICEIGEMYE